MSFTNSGSHQKGSNVSPALSSLDRRHKYLKKIQDDSGKGAIYKSKDDEDFE